MNQKIPLSQKLYLLGIHPEKGGLLSSTYNVINIVLPGALIFELYQNSNIGIENKKVTVKSLKTEDPLHSFILEKLKQKSNPVKISAFIGQLQRSQKFIRNEVQQGLVDKRIIKMEPRQLLFIHWKKSKIINKQLLHNLVSEVENIVFKGTEDSGELMLLSMLKPAGLLKRLFPEREKRKRATERIKKMMAENQVSKAVSDAIEVMQAVAAATVITAATAGAHR